MHLTFYMQKKVQKVTGKVVPDGLARPLDDDNAIAMFKSGRDSLEQAGVVANDKGIKIGTVKMLRSRADCNGTIGVLVEIEVPD